MPSGYCRDEEVQLASGCGGQWDIMSNCYSNRSIYAQKTFVIQLLGGLQFCSPVEHLGLRPHEHATCPFHNGSIDESGLLKVHSLPRMALNLAESQHAQICDMLLSNCPPAE